MIEFVIGMVVLVGVITWTIWNDYGTTSNAIHVGIGTCVVVGFWVLSFIRYTIEALL